MGEHDPNSRWFQRYPASLRPDQASTPRADQNQLNREVSPADESDAVRIEDSLADDHGHSAGHHVVKPYAIEEPDDEATYASENPPILVPQDNGAETWQWELVDSLKCLHCDSDHSDSRLPSPKQGTKRRPTKPPSGGPESVQSESMLDVEYEEPRRYAKRQRTRSKRSRESLGTVHDLYTRRSRRLSGSSDNSLSTDASDETCTSGSTAPEEMDID